MQRDLDYHRCADGFRNAMSRANHRAQEFNHRAIDLHHLLLALAEETGSVSSAILLESGAPLDCLRADIVAIAPIGPGFVLIGKLPSAADFRLAIDFSFEEADQLGHQSVDTDHLFLGLLRVRSGVAAEVLRGFSVDLNSTYAE